MKQEMRAMRVHAQCHAFCGGGVHAIEALLKRGDDADAVLVYATMFFRQVAPGWRVLRVTRPREDATETWQRSWGRAGPAFHPDDGTLTGHGNADLDLTRQSAWLIWVAEPGASEVRWRHHGTPHASGTLWPS